MPKIPNASFSFASSSDLLVGTIYTITMKAIGPMRNFYTFGIYGRDFSLDEKAKGEAGISQISFLVVLAFAVALNFINML